MAYQKADQIAEGKTKRVFAVQGEPALTILEYKPDITAYDDPKFTKQFAGKDVYSCTTTCRVFELLKRHDLPVAYFEQISPIAFVALRCQMIPLEVVARMFALGSYLKRYPELKTPEGQPPPRFSTVIVEFFLKTTKGELRDSTGKFLLSDLDPQKGEEDPLIINPRERVWRLYHSKKPLYDPASKLKQEVYAIDLLGNDYEKKIFKMESLLKKTFVILTNAWNKFGCRLIDMKIEFGESVKDGELLIADVIDNDSWRLRDANWRELSKEVFRQGGDLATVANNYELVAKLASQF